MQGRRLSIALGLALAAGVGAAAEPQIPVPDLEAGFAHPPLAARTRAYWWWLNGNVTQAAITRDLEWMQAIGMGGGLIFDAGGATQGGHTPVPAGPLFGSPEWRELFKHAVREADRLGLEVSLNIQSGWNLGGPVVQPEDATKCVAWSEQRLAGPQKFSGALPEPKARDGFYRDTFVLAYRMKEGAGAAKPQISASSAQTKGDPGVMIDGLADTYWVSQGSEEGQGPSAKRPEWVALSFPQAVTLGGVRVVGRPGYGPREGEWQASDDGKTFKTVQAFSAENGKPAEIRFAPATATDFRLLVRSSYDPREPKAPRNVQIAELTPLDAKGQPLFAAGGRATPIQNLQSKAAFHELGGSAANCAALLDDVPATPGEEDVAAADVLDLSGQLAVDGTLDWDVPAGMWKVLRFGYTLNGAKVSTASGEWQGRVIDYLDAEAFEGYWKQVVEPIIADAGPLAGKSLKCVQTDSWELGGVNWTKTFAAEFRKRRGYDIQPWLPVIAGAIVNSRAESNRFLNDFRRTIADLVYDNHYALMAEHARRHGMGTQPESGGPHAACLDALRNFGLNAMPMSEFWVPSPHRPTDEARFFVKQAAAAAHIYGKPVACAEGFTSIGPQWNDVLWSAQKPSFDHEACAGLNLVFWHAFTCSPAEMGLPGQEYFAGTHFNPNITWAGQAHAFIGYLDRCQFLLQQGLFAADVAHYYGDNVPSFVRLKKDDPAGVLPGYDYDVFNQEVLLTRMSVRDGRLVLPDGMSYRAMTLAKLPAMSLAALKKIDELVRAGATVLGPRPEHPTGLEGYPACDAEMKRIADGLWGPAPLADAGEHAAGKGRIVWGKPTQEVLAAAGIPPDVEWTADPPADAGSFDWIHRRTADAELYFISCQSPAAASAAFSFRIAGRQPEIWDPVTARRWDAAAFAQQGGRTVVPLRFAPYGSVFVVFRRPIAENASGGAASNFPDFKPVVEIRGPWAVAFDPKWGGPAAATFDKLVSWTQRPEEGIRYYAGSATYRTTFEWAPPAAPAGGGKPAIALDLGAVGNLAEVTLNGKKLGVAWAPPFRVDVADALRPGANALEVVVVNTWFNRLVLDQRLPPEKRLTRTNIVLKKGAEPAESGLLGPVTLQAAEK